MKFARYILLCFPLLWGCEAFLEVKPASSLDTITELKDLQAILDNERLNEGYPDIGDLASDYYFLTEEDWNTLPLEYRVNYVWGDEVPPHFNTWSTAYEKVFYSNTILENVDQVAVGNMQETDRRRIKGEAYFVRGLNFYFLSQLFAPPLDASNGVEKLGIPLRLTSDFNVPSERSTMKTMYDQMTMDLATAVQLLPETPAFRTKPSKAAAYVVLMRVSLAVGDYQLAEAYADSCLIFFPQLIDFNTLDTTDTRAIDELNDEVIYHMKHLGSSGMLSNARLQVAPELYNDYEEGDLRKIIFFKYDASGVLRFFGDYGGYNGSIFSGMATDELYITRSECRVRNGDIDGGLSDLNYLLRHRIKTSRFEPIQTANSEDLLHMIIQERYKELAFRGNIRWPDLRRLNKDARFARTLRRNLGGEQFVLPPNHPRYVFKIPLDVIELTGMEQNN